MTNIKSNNYVVAIGELLWDVLPSGAVIGGAPANFAYRAGSIGVPTFLISAIGDDELGKDTLKALEERKVATRYVQINKDFPTGTVDVVLSSTGSASYTINTGVAYDNMEITDPALEVASSASLFCFGTLTQRSEKSRATIRRIISECKEPKKLLDINLRKDCFNKEIVEYSLNAADIVKLNDEEAIALCQMFKKGDLSLEESIKWLVKDFSLECCIITKAEKGVVAYSEKSGLINIAGLQVSVVDTIGAGDAFTAAFVFKYLQGAELLECCQYGNALGGLVAQTRGGMSKIDLKEVEDKYESVYC